MAELIGIATGTDRNRGNVIFVHGLGGDPFTTWGGTSKNDPMFWPGWIADEFPELAVLTIAYDAAPTSLKGQAMGIVDRAGNILDRLLNDPKAVRLLERPIAFICHSLGGLVVKQLILDAVRRRGDGKVGTSDTARLVEQITQVVFLGTPHDGASLANVARLFGIASEATRDLTPGNQRLLEQGKLYRQLEKTHGIALKHKVYFEKYPTGALGLVVKKDSSNPKLDDPDADPIAADTDHIAICKPASKTGKGADVHLGVCRLLRELPAGRPPDTRISRANMAMAAVAEKKIVHPGLRAGVQFFTGRAFELAALDSQLWSNPHHAVALTNSHNRELALRGDAGVGKSALALQYAHLNANRYAGAWLIRSETDETLCADLIELGEKIGVTWSAVDDTPDKKARRVATHIADHAGSTPWLLVYDNVEQPKQIAHLTPIAGAHVLVTSRSPRMAETMVEQPVGVLKPEHAVAFLMTGTRDRRVAATVEVEARRLADALGCLPLALKHARAYHLARGIYFETYLKRLPEFIAKAPGEEKTVYATYIQNIERAIDEHPLALAYLELWAFMAPDNIPEDLDPDWAVSEEDREAAIGALFGVSACERNARGVLRLVSLHRLEQLVVRERLKASPQGNQRYQSRLENATNVLERAWFKTRDHHGLLPPAGRERRALLAPHVEAMQRFANDHKLHSMTVSNLAIELGDWAAEHGDRGNARRLFDRALTIRQIHQAKAPDDSSRSYMLTFPIDRLAAMDLADDERKKAREGFTRSRDILQRLVNANPSVADYRLHLTYPISQLAAMDLAKGKRKEARDGFTASMKIWQRLADDHPHIPSYQRELTVPIERLADMDLVEDRLEAARTGFTKSLNIWQFLINKYPYLPDHVRGSTIPQSQLAAVDICDGNIANAVNKYQHIHTTMRRLANSNPANLLFRIDLAEHVLWLALMESAQALGGERRVTIALRDLVLHERGKAVDSLPKRIAELRSVLARVTIPAKRRVELVAAEDALRKMDAAGQLVQSAKDWHALINVALAAPPPKRGGIVRRVLGV